MFWEGWDAKKDISEVEKDVARMLERFLAIAHIHPDEADYLDRELGLKTTMPEGWNWEAGLVEARLIEAEIELG
jgi:hypothetical protein